MDFKKLKKKLNNKVHPACVWIILGIMVPFLLISYNVLFEPSFMPAPIMDFSKKVVGVILGDKVITKPDTNLIVNNNLYSNNSNQETTTDTSSWQTYENKELGFSLKYPSDWNEYKSFQSGVTFASSKDVASLEEEERRSMDTGNPYTFGKVIAIDKDILGDYKTIEEYAKTLLSTDSEGYLKDFTASSGLPGIYVYDKGPNRYGGGIGEYYIFVLENTVYKISLDHTILSETADNNFSSILRNVALNFKIY